MTTTPVLDLKNLRRMASLSQKDLADLLAVDQSQISRWEASPDGLPLSLVLSLSQVLGLSVEEMLTGTELEPDLAPRVDLDGRQGLERFAQLVAGVGTSFDGLTERAAAHGLRGPAEVHHLIGGLIRKPRVLMVGPFDGGKSTFVNILLERRSLAVRYQPTTSLVTVVRHEDDRPAWLQAPMTDWLAQNIGRQTSPSVLILRAGFDVDRVDDEEHVRDHYLTAGDLDLLAQVGTHGADHGLEGAAYGVVFLDAEILKVCDLIDTPGSDASDDDDQLSEVARQSAHVLVHLSPPTGFMSASQVSYLLPGMRSLTPYSDVPAVDRVFLVASHAHAGISDMDLDEVLTGGAVRVSVAMRAETDGANEPGDDGASAAEEQWSPEQIRARMFAFYDSNGRGPSRGGALLQKLTVLLAEDLPATAAQHLANQLTGAVDGFVEQLGRQEAALEAAENASSELPDLEETALKVEKAVKSTKRKLNAAINVRRTRSLTALHEAFSRRLDVVQVEKLIRSKYSQKAFLEAGRGDENPKKAAQEEVGGLIVSQLQNDLAKVLERESLQFGKELDNELDALAISISNIDVASGSFDIPYDLRGAFVGAALSTATVGALAVWASTLGNLGAYIIAAQAAGWLSAVGISLPAGGATMTAAMAAVGGPVGVAIAIIMIGVLLGLMFRSDWEERLAKALVKGFDKPNKKTGKTIRDLLQEAVTNYWDDTRSSVEAGLDNVIAAHRAELEQFRGLVGDDVDTAAKRQARRALLTDLKGFFQELLTAIRISRRLI
ncbi:helix-turn-helix domain-containing protein [Terrabacter sp. RAF57]|uniref:helix-turn-helix domain-containing protein n=1 Tax=Terrabacter sp. RAF57 TaxID=3233063 RepID=UPI003F9C389A